ncbi:hypothetical protein K7432_000271 [Basidiobolus ranarum]|uniref:GDP/GTP exchange factor Sec2 N-terminal domain-containing protein n=1 Tax=Basidiobolus ranarum TaxID=34480 RepID=A0ABR2WBF0_9FUNG
MTVSQPRTFDSNELGISTFTNSSQLTVDSDAENPYLEINSLRIRLAELEQEKFNTEQRLLFIEKDLKSSKEIIAELRITLAHIKRQDATQYELDMKRLAEKLIDETELRGEVEHAKFELENELEELSIKLFEEANKMVVEQRKVCAEIKRKNIILERQLEEYRELSSLQSEQLVELKCNFIKTKPVAPQHKLPPLTIHIDKKLTNSDLFDNPLPSPKSSTYTDDSISNDRGSLLSELDKQSYDSCMYSEESTIGEHGLSFNFDDIRYIEFKEFLEQPPKNIFQSKFVKRCITEDIDVLMRFDTTAGVRSWFQNRKLATAVQVGTIVIEPLFTNYEQKETQLQYARSNCTLCNHHVATSTNYTYRLDDHDVETKIACSFCRERLISVCDFYSFLRMIHSGILKSSHEKLYNDCLRIRLKMFLARVGSHICYEGEEEHGSCAYPSPKSQDGV